MGKKYKFSKADLEEGQIVEVSEIKAKYEEAVGHKTGIGQIYEVLARHGWRRVMLRSRHSKKADEEVIETSKKLSEQFPDDTILLCCDGASGINRKT